MENGEKDKFQYVLLNDKTKINNYLFKKIFY